MKTKILLGKHYLELASAKDYVNWAIEMLKKKTTESLILLSGMSTSDKDSLEEHSQLFFKSLKELGFEFLQNKNIYTSEYTKHIAKEVLKRKIDPKEGLNIMLNIYDKEELDVDIYLFKDLKEEIDYQTACNEPLLMNKIITNNLEEEILEKFIDFLAVTRKAIFVRHSDMERNIGNELYKATKGIISPLEFYTWARNEYDKYSDQNIYYASDYSRNLLLDSFFIKLEDLHDAIVLESYIPSNECKSDIEKLLGTADAQFWFAIDDESISCEVTYRKTQQN